MPPAGGDPNKSSSRIKATALGGARLLRSARRQLVQFLLPPASSAFFRNLRTATAAEGHRRPPLFARHGQVLPQVLADVLEFLVRGECLRLAAANSLLHDLVVLRLLHPQKVGKEGGRGIC
jgi:hypothetical protein